MKAYDLEITGSLITSGSLTVRDDLDVQGLVTNKYLQGGASNTLDAPYYHFDGIFDDTSDETILSSQKINFGDVDYIDGLKVFSVSIWFKAGSVVEDNALLFSK